MFESRSVLPACERLEKWTERNTGCGDQIQTAYASMSSRGSRSLEPSHAVRVRADLSAHGRTWLRADEMKPLDAVWRRVFA